MSKKYVFVDWSNVEAGYGTPWPNRKTGTIYPWGIEIKAHRPRVTVEPVMIPDKPWEQTCLNCYATFLKIDGKIRVWYEAIPPEEGGNIDMSSLLCYAESEDGIHFTKPNLGIFEYHGSKENNIVKNVHGTTVLYDKNAPESERYKMIRTIYIDKPTGGHSSSVYGAVSPDGIHWTDLDDVILDNPSDTQNFLSVDDKGEYSIYTRQVRGYPKRRRSIAVSRSKDFSKFPKPTMLLHSDPTDPPDWDYYTSGYHRWPGAEDAHLMLIDMFHRVQDTFDVHLALSSDGMIWYRPLGQQAYLATGEYGEFDAMTVSSTNGIIDMEDGTWNIYIMTSPRGHNDDRIDYPWLPYGGYWKATLREDGFTSIHAETRGEFHTVPVKLTDTLQVNAAMLNRGFVKVGLFDPETQEPVPGFTTEDCDPLERNKIWQTVSWKGSSDLSQFAEGKKKYQIRFEMFKSDLYAFKV
ncbi:MAG: hypothetical protein IJC19_03245 [Clostridia bacterium]|nr:hypothetical protein [Clostridia bacterium]